MLGSSFFSCVNFLLFLLLLPRVFVHVGGTEVRNINETYLVVFDAGSSGTRVHVFHFDDNLDLVPIDGQLEIYDKVPLCLAVSNARDETEMVTPGLSSYAADPEKAASSIASLLKKAVDAIPTNLHSRSPLQLGATAGLRLVGEEKSEKILEAIRRLFSNSSLLYEKNEVAVISGTQEGAYMWVAMNYLLGYLGNEYSKTIGVVDLGGASVQMSYAVSADAAANAPKTGHEYITKHHLKGINYNLYVHSYLRYGQDAARTIILQSTNSSFNYCILTGYNGTYTYNGAMYNARSSHSGSNFKKCRKNVLRALNVNAKCEVKNCTFDGVWNGGGGAGQDKLYLASAFFYRAQDVNIIDTKAKSGKATPADFKRAAIATCALKSPEAAKTKYPNVWDSNLPFICMDQVYQYILLTAGFGLKEDKEVTLINELKYNDFNVEAAWPLGSAIERVSGMSSTKPEARNMYRFWSHANTE